MVQNFKITKGYKIKSKALIPVPSHLALMPRMSSYSQIFSVLPENFCTYTAYRCGLICIPGPYLPQKVVYVLNSVAPFVRLMLNLKDLFMLSHRSYSHF